MSQRFLLRDSGVRYLKIAPALGTHGTYEQPGSGTAMPLNRFIAETWMLEQMLMKFWLKRQNLAVNPGLRSTL